MSLVQIIKIITILKKHIKENDNNIHFPDTVFSGKLARGQLLTSEIVVCNWSPIETDLSLVLRVGYN